MQSDRFLLSFSTASGQCHQIDADYKVDALGIASSYMHCSCQVLHALGPNGQLRFLLLISTF